MTKIAPKDAIIKLIDGAFHAIALPKTNNALLQETLKDAHIALAMKSLGTGKAKKLTDQFKKTYGKKLADCAYGTDILLDQASPYSLLVRKKAGRTSFDKESFIKAVAKEYDLSIMALNTLAAKHVKTTAAPLSFSVIVAEDAPSEAPY